jgi:hypothetical protein
MWTQNSEGLTTFRDTVGFCWTRTRAKPWLCELTRRMHMCMRKRLGRRNPPRDVPAADISDSLGATDIKSSAYVLYVQQEQVFSAI